MGTRLLVEIDISPLDDEGKRKYDELSVSMLSGINIPLMRLGLLKDGKEKLIVHIRGGGKIGDFMNYLNSSLDSFRRGEMS